MTMPLRRPASLALAAAFLFSLPCRVAQAQDDAAKPGTAQDKSKQAAPAKKAEKAKVSVLRFDGIYADLPSDSIDVAALLLGQGGGKQSSFFEMRERLEALAKKGGDTDQAVADQALNEQPVFLDLTRPFALNGVQVRELERSMQRVRASGRKTVAYLENATSIAYQVAALCDQVLMADMGSIDLHSLSMSITFMQDAFDLLGVDVDVVRCGDFKGAVEPYVLPKMSDHLRRHYKSMLERMNDDVVRRLAEARALDPAKVRELQAQRLLTAKQALEAGLIDRIVPYDGAQLTLERIVGNADFETELALTKDTQRKNFNLMAAVNNLFSPRAKKEKKQDKDTIAVLHLAGTIIDGQQDAAGSIVSVPAVEEIDRLRDDEKVRGIVVRINSPGGSATASEMIRRALVRLAEKKPVVFSMGSVAASGGYWITCIDRPIYAEATTITGSIGVFGMKTTFGPLMRRVGLHEEVIALDDAYDLDSISTSWSEASKERLQTHVGDVYERFLDIASKSRHLQVKDLEPFAGGRVWSGEQARDRGLVDAIGGLDQAIARVASEAKLEAYETIHTPKAKSALDALVGQLFAKSLFENDALQLARQRLGNLDTALNVIFASITNEGRPQIWALLPAEIRFR